MAPQTPNKGYEVQVTGSNSGTWGDVLNDDMISPVDNNMGGIVTKNVAGSNITLSATESEMAIVRLTGAQSADVLLTTSCLGFFFVENLTTNAFNVSVVNDQVATSVVVPKGHSTVLSDDTNGCRIGGTDSFPTGTKMPFFQTSAPTGWTKDTSLDNATIRLVSGTVGADGGSANFTDVFTSRTILKANLPSYNLTVIDPGHDHNISFSRYTLSGTAGGGGPNGTLPTATSTGTSTTGITVNSGGSGTAMDFAVKYANAIRATKN